MQSDTVKGHKRWFIEYLLQRNFWRLKNNIFNFQQLREVLHEQLNQACVHIDMDAWKSRTDFINKLGSCKKEKSMMTFGIKRQKVTCSLLIGPFNQRWPFAWQNILLYPLHGRISSSSKGKVQSKHQNSFLQQNLH